MIGTNQVYFNGSFDVPIQYDTIGFTDAYTLFNKNAEFKLQMQLSI